MGCFRDYFNYLRVLPNQLYTSQSGYQACFQLAQEAGYRYVGLEYWNGPAIGVGESWGGNSLASAEGQGVATNCAQVQTTDGSVMWGGIGAIALYDLWDTSLDFETIVSTTEFQYYPVGSVIGGWTTGGTNYVGIVSHQNGIGFASPFPNNLQYACWLQTDHAISSITRMLTGVVVGKTYFVSVWTVCRFFSWTGGDSCPPSQSFTVQLDGVTVYSTSPSSLSWVQVSSAAHTATDTSMSVMFQLSTPYFLYNEFDVAIDAIAVQPTLQVRPVNTPFLTSSDTHPTSDTTSHILVDLIVALFINV